MDGHASALGRNPSRWPSPEHRLFFALRPDSEARVLMVHQWVDLCARLGLRATPVPPHGLHLSLLGIAGDDVPPPRWLVDLLSAAAAQVPSVPFEIELDRVQSFERADARKPLVLTETRRTEALTVLHDRLRAAVADAGLRLPGGGFSTPHVTLSYGQPLPEPLPIPPIRLVAHEFCLIHSHRGRSSHEVLGRWPLRGWN